MNTNPNNQLPDEVFAQIAAKAKDITVKLGWVDGAADQQDAEGACIIIATEYATKLQLEKDDNQVNLQEITNLSNLVREKDERIRLLTKAMGEFDNENKDNYKSSKEARALLEKFISRHEAGLLPDMHIYNEIKTFLDGKK